MLIISMGGGLGNQMFEYAFYYHLKTLFPTQSIKIDDRYAFPIAHNGIEIFKIFGLQAQKANYEEVQKLTKGYLMNGEKFDTNTLFQKLRKKIFKCPKTMKIQKDFTEYDDTFLKRDVQDSYFYGVFANYYYFKDVENDIKKIFKFPQIKDKTNNYYENLIKESNSVSIHVRNGDYSSHGIELTSIEFYKKAIDLMDKSIRDAKYFIFTDDKEYAYNLFNNSNKYIIIQGNTGVDSFRDMQLMSLCKHNITANSTFSFWGGVLNKNKDKIVISPNLPFTGSKYPFICDDWIVL